MATMSVDHAFRIRQATLEDVSAIEALIERSARALSADDYTPEQIAGALGGAFGVDTQLIADGTYFVVEADEMIAACGGWSFRATLFGADSHPARDAAELDPVDQAAKIRAFFVDPTHARRGLGSMLLGHCEEQARARGFSALELMATLPGLRLYQACGFVEGKRIEHDLSSGRSILFVAMHKTMTRSSAP